MTDMELNHIVKSLPVSKNLDETLMANVKDLVLQFKLKNPDWDHKKTKSYVEVCIYLTFISQSSLSFLNFFEQIVNLHLFMISLKEILKKVTLSPSVYETASKLIKSYAISLMNYKKLEEIYDKLNLSGQYTHLSFLFQSIWLFFINIRKEKYNGSEDLSECGCLIISVLNLFLGNLPDTITYSLGIPLINHLCNSFRTVPSYVQGYIEKVQAYTSELTLKRVFQLDLKTSLNATNIVDFISSLNSVYISSPDNSLDERLIRNTVCNSELLLTPITRKTAAVATTRGRVLTWEENVSVKMNASLNEILKPTAAQFQPETPITSAMECSSWLAKLLQEYSESSIKKISTDTYQEVTQRAESLKNTFLEFINRRKAISTNKANDILILYYVSLENLLKIEKNKGINVTPILQNDKFNRALFGCCTETVLYVAGANYIPFEEILELYGINAFDFWKNINSFIQFDIRMPLQVEKHFRDLEQRVITMDGWEESGPIGQVIARMGSEAVAELSHPSFGQFFKKVLSYSANRITEICTAISLSASIQEEIWNSFKYFLSEKTEFLISRHLDHIILCSIYGVCKSNRADVTFKSLFDQHNLLYQADPQLFIKVKLLDNRTGDLIKFYNEVYIQTMKDYLNKKVTVAAPRISSLNPMSPLKVSLQPFQTIQAPQSLQPVKSPFLTPRTKKLWAFGENVTLQGMNSIIQAVPRKLNFDMPIKRPKTDDSSH